MNRVRLHIRPAPIVAGAAEENQIMTAVTACAPYRPVREDVEQGRDDPVVIDLVTRARGGDIRAWDALVERFAPVIWSICRQHRLGRADADGDRRREPPVPRLCRSADWDFDGRGHDGSFPLDQNCLGRYGEVMVPHIGASPRPGSVPAPSGARHG